MFHLTKKRAVAMAVVGSLALSAGAYAYFSAAGTGDGSATAGSTAAVTIAQDVSTSQALYPGKSSPVVVTTHNTGSGPQYVKSVNLASVDTGVAGCDPAWFTMPAISIDRTLQAGTTSDPFTGSLTMTETSTDQNLCQNAHLTLHFSSN
jgi:hypothetical protein